MLYCTEIILEFEHGSITVHLDPNQMWFWKLYVKLETRTNVLDVL